MVQEFLFRGIQRQEWTNLFSFIQAKGIRVENLEEAQQGPGGNAQLDYSGFDLGEDIDTGTLPLRPILESEAFHFDGNLPLPPSVRHVALQAFQTECFPQV